jgi:hypothetical protein
VRAKARARRRSGFLGRPAAIDRRLGDPGSDRDLVHRERSEADLAKELQRDVQDLFIGTCTTWTSASPFRFVTHRFDDGTGVFSWDADD